MERRKAITTAAAASLTLLAGAAGIAVNSGILDASGDGDVGRISPVDSTTNPPVTLYVADPSITPTTAAPRIQPTTAPPVTTSAPSGYQVDDRDEHEDDDQERERDSDDGHEHEGADDDD